MATTPGQRQVFFLANSSKPNALAALDELQAFARPRTKIVGASQALYGREAVHAGAERVVVLGGDGTLIGVARSLGADQIPLIGVNVGKLGFLAEFSVEEFKQCFDRAVADDSLITRRTVLQVTVDHGSGRPAGTRATAPSRKEWSAGTANSDARHATRDVSLAINDCVIQAGPPFRIITLGVAVNGQHLTDVAGDGLIVCTPGGSTAHNLSAGGPIVHPEVSAIVLTPLSPHSLTHRPLVVECGSQIEITARRVNEGTTVIVDGQVSSPLKPGERVTVRRFTTDFLLVHNPLYPRWHNLVTKLHWGRSPSCE